MHKTKIYYFKIEFRANFKSGSLSIVDFNCLIGDCFWLKSQKLNPHYRLFHTSLRPHVVTGKSAKKNTIKKPEKLFKWHIKYDYEFFVFSTMQTFATPFYELPIS